jgi:hypothetical protein
MCSGPKWVSGLAQIRARSAVAFSTIAGRRVWYHDARTGAPPSLEGLLLGLEIPKLAVRFSKATGQPTNDILRMRIEPRG